MSTDFAAPFGESIRAEKVWLARGASSGHTARLVERAENQGAK